MKTYSKHVVALSDLPKACQRVLGYILDKMNGDNEIGLSGGSRTLAMRELKIKPSTFGNALQMMVDKDILAMPEKSFYVANPYIFTKKKKWGDVLNQRKKFRAIIDYDIDERFTIRGEWK